MYFHVKTMYDQWSNGQSEQECLARREVFIALVCTHIGYDPEILHEFLARQQWFPKPLDDQLE